MSYTIRTGYLIHCVLLTLKSYQELIKHTSKNARPTTVFIQCYLIIVDLQQSTAMTPTESPFYLIFSPREGEGDKLNTVICKY